MAEARMTISEHFEELRKRLGRCLIAVAVAGLAAFWQIKVVMEFMRRPLDEVVGTMTDAQVSVVQTELHGGFMSAMKVAFFAGLVIASPVVLGQMWAFIGAGLYRHERRAVKFYALPGFGLFLSGAALAYFFVMPYAIRFLLEFGHETVGLDASLLDVNNLMSLIAIAMFMFGLLFQLPVVMVFLMRIGVVEPGWFAKYRRHAIVTSFAVAMVLTPPDPLTQIALASCMSLLYESAIWIGRILARPRATEES